MASSNLPPNTPFFDKNGNLATEWYRFFVSLVRTADGASAGEVVTDPTGGLAGGGPVSGGLTLSIADNGVSNSMLRQSNGTSVIGRSAGSSGNVGDIIAGGDGRVLTRDNGTLAFRAAINGVSVGPVDPAPVRCTTFRIDQTPSAGVIVPTHTITISADGVDYKVPAVAA